MLKKIKRAARSTLHQTPWLLNLYLRRKFPVELKLIAGKHHPASSHPSLIHFSFNKAATQHTKNVLRRIARENNITPVHINEYAFYTRFPYMTAVSQAEMMQYEHIFKPEGYMYSAFGGMVRGIPGLERYRILLMVRDPRDILVSWYYSLAFSHSTPPRTSNRYADFMEKRQKARQLSIDEQVLTETERVYSIFETYRKLLLEPYPHVYLTSYEKMTADYAAWLRGILAAWELEISPGLFHALIEENQSLKPDQENVHSHIRKGEPGDYKNKLQPGTIDTLNQKFAPIFESFKEAWE